MFKSIFTEADWNGEEQTTEEEIETAMNSINVVPILSDYSFHYPDGSSFEFNQFNLGDVLNPSSVDLSLKDGASTIPAGITVERIYTKLKYAS